jgi:hypothetical protein
MCVLDLIPSVCLPLYVFIPAKILEHSPGGRVQVDFDVATVILFTNPNPKLIPPTELRKFI